MTDVAAYPDVFGLHYERALDAPDAPLLLREHAGAGGTRHDLARYLGAADDVERRLVRDLAGSVLDVGCGPGRMVQAARDAGLVALGVDVSATAARIAHRRGIPVWQGSVFDDVPHEGAWAVVLLFDGNIGIGGDPSALLRRCGELMCPGGRVVVEAHPDPRRDRRFRGVLADATGAVGTPFPWAEVGRHPLRRYARDARLLRAREWQAGGRWFAEYVRPADAAETVARRSAP